MKHIAYGVCFIARKIGQFVPPEEVDLNELAPDEEEALMNAIHKLVARVR